MADYALLLADPPVARTSQSRLALQTAEAQARVQSLQTAQSSVLDELGKRKVAIRGSSQILVNAVFVTATPDTARQLLTIPGVVHVVHLPRLRRDLDQALGLENVSAAWSALGGSGHAGAGMKIGIIDTGIDQNHPGFQDASLTPPSGFPKCDTANQPNCATYTNNKVIVARSYVALDTDTNPQYSTPDDYSPVDHVGHGTAIAMIAAGTQNTGPQAVIQGVAPKAFLGNYKVFGSPGVNDFALFTAINAAVQDALADGMDVVTLSLGEGNMPDYGPLDVDPSCSSDGKTAVACDIYAQMVESAVTAGMVVVASAGNDGNVGTQPHTLSTIHTPGTAPSAITVGASYNSHLLLQAVHVLQNGGTSGVPSNLQVIHALASDGPQAPTGTLTIVDVTTLGDNGLACSPLPAQSLVNDIALIQRGTCPFSDKILNAENAGALGVILYQLSGVNTLINPTGANNTGIPAVMIGYTDGINLKTYLAGATGVSGIIDPSFTPVSNPPSSVWPSSSRGPSIGTFTESPYTTFVIKPELVAVGAGIYTATQKLDPNGDTYNATGYAGVTGTSYAVPMVAGAVALVKQMHPTWTPAQLKSAVVNTATQDVTDTDGSAALVDAVGTGKLDAGSALNVAATLNPPTIEFGPLTTPTVSSSMSVIVTNVSSASATFNFTVQQRVSASSVTVAVSPASLTLGAGQQGTVSVTLKGTLPAPGSYEGLIAVAGGPTTLHLPYQYLVGSGVVSDVFPVFNGAFIDFPSDPNSWAIQPRAIDQYGVPVLGSSVLFRVASGGGSIGSGDKQTFRYGVATGFVYMGSQLGPQIFDATVGGVTAEFDAYARPLPVIAAGGVVDSAAAQGSRGLAPGSYITIYGANLADVTHVFSTNYLPVSLSDVSVSFDGGGLSLPGHLYFVSPGQINVQIPWEFQGQSSVSMKVNVTGNEWYLQSAVYTLSLAQYCPGFFVNPSSGIVAAVDYQQGTVVSAAAPAQRGDILELYLNGMGPVTNQTAVLSGQPSPGGSLLPQTTTNPTVSIGGVNAAVAFAGLAPGIVGLYQVNVTLPATVSSGTQPIVLSIGGLSTQISQLPVK